MVSFVTGVAAAVVVTRVFRLPPVELSGRVNLWWGLVFVLQFLVALVRGLADGGRGRCSTSGVSRAPR